MYYDEETKKVKAKKQEITKALRRVKAIVKRIAEKKNTKDFINKVNPLQKEVNNLFTDLFLLNAIEYAEIKYKQDDFESYVNKAWALCQGDARVSL